MDTYLRVDNDIHYLAKLQALKAKKTLKQYIKDLVEKDVENNK